MPWPHGRVPLASQSQHQQPDHLMQRQATIHGHAVVRRLENASERCCALERAQNAGDSHGEFQWEFQWDFPLKIHGIRHVRGIF